MLGVMLAVVGTWFCSDGGRHRENQASPEGGVSLGEKRSRAFWNCVILTLASGAIGSGMNIALAFPNPIFTVAHKYGSTDFGATTAFLAPYLLGAFFSNVIYAGRLVHKNHTFENFFAASLVQCLFWTFVMAVLFLAGEYSYAGAVSRLGAFGAVITWGLSVAAMILTASVWDVWRGEWSGRAARQMAVGVAVLIFAVITLGFAQYFYHLSG